MKNTKAYPVALPTEHSEVKRSEAGPAGVGAERPDPEVVAKAKRRSFTGEYKQRILAEADQAKAESGGIGALLRPSSVRSVQEQGIRRLK